MARVTLSAQGDPFWSPTPYPDLPKRSPAVIRSQSRAASNSSLELSQMKAWSFLVNGWRGEEKQEILRPEGR